MEDPTALLEQVFKSKSFEEVPEVLRLVTSNLFKFTKQMASKQAEHTELLQGLLLRAQAADLKLSDKASIKDIEELLQIVGKYESASSASDDYNLDVKLTSRNTVREVYQQPQGLDRVMIQEVKTIAQALIERRIALTIPKYQERPMIERQPDHVSRFEDSMEYRQMKGELAKLADRINEINERKIDDFDLEERVRKQRQYVNSEIEKSARKSLLRAERTDQKEKILKVEHDLQSIRYSLKRSVAKPVIADFGVTSQLQEFRVALEKKADKKQLTDFKSRISKEISTKPALESVETIVKGIQQQIFGKDLINVDKINQQRKLQELTIQKLVKAEIARNKEQIPLSSNKINEIKHTISRVEKKISNKLQSEREQCTNEAVQRVQAELEGQLKRVEVQTSKQIKSLFEIVQASLQDEDSKISRFSLKKTKRPELTVSDFAKWTCSSDLQLKQGLICWEKEESNSNTQTFMWERKKTQLMVVTPGIYEVKLAVFCNKLPMVTLLVDNQPAAFVQRQERIRSREEHSTCLIQFLMLTGRNKLSVKVQEQIRVDALLCIKRHA